MECAAGLMDLLMLASGFQSNGLPMVWTAEDLIGAFTLASFLEKVSKRSTQSCTSPFSLRPLCA